LNVGGAYPNQKFSVVIKGSNRDKFKEPPEKMFAGKTICVTGHITMYKGRPEIVVSDPKQIEVKD
jgi:DNA/RNA endonuclease YhcR with UshA esterase domain